MTDDLRTQLAAALEPKIGAMGPGPIGRLVDLLLPVVDAHGRASAATALREAADEWERHGWTVVTLEALRARADDCEAPR